MNRKFYIVLSYIVLLLGAFLILKDFHCEQVKIWDEASSAKNAIDMLANKNFIVQYDNGVPVRDDFKPPLTLWTKMIAYELFGINSFSVRFFSVLSALLTIFILWYYAFFVLKRPAMGVILALLLATSKGYVDYHVARNGDPDAMLVFFVTAAIILLFELFRTYPEKRGKLLLLLGAAITMAAYTKGIMGFVPLAGAGLYLLLKAKGRKILSDFRFYLPFMSALILLALYYVAREILDPGYMEGVLKYEVFSFKEAPEFVKHPEFSFYFNYLLNFGFNPYFYFIPLSVVVFFVSKDKLIKDIILFSGIAAAFFLLGMSKATLKNEWYISPVYPYMVFLVGAGLIGFKDILISKFFTQNTIYLKVITVVFWMAVFLLAWPSIRTINGANHAYRTYTYYPEREGRFLNAVKTKMPEIMDMHVIMPHHPRQLMFYMKKWEYVDKTKTSSSMDIPEGFNSRYIIVCDKELKEQVIQDYPHKVLLFDEYCVLLEITESQD